MNTWKALLSIILAPITFTLMVVVAVLTAIPMSYVVNRAMMTSRSPRTTSTRSTSEQEASEQP